MKTTINQIQFRDAFYTMDRGNNFSFNGLNALFDYLEEYEESTGEEVELDVIALCCDYTEYKDLQEIIDNYGAGKFSTLEELQDYTQVIEFDGGIIIQDF